ncbi:threonine dehydratase [Deinobacterium chartae]|uniref:Threonine dehydratase n=1 Tax=Deinobacterium chartae TaxID=521158 RepID=A0A841HXJ3_9DEIO|nr:threonine/serine dehydratase [Deinobacterium chartae]MBB6098127.1 threonine dehydratase [Deinobacterium chartae]
MTLSVPDILVTLSEIQQAADRLRGHALRTPLLPFPGEALHLKAENLQPTGAFKLRGALNVLLGLSEAERARGVVAHSSGNHAQAVAWAAAALGVRAVVVMPENAPAVKFERTRALGAEVVVVEASHEAREQRTEQLVLEQGLVPVLPYDDRRIIAGAGTVGLEILEDLPGLQTVLVPVSGGGLISGVAAAIKRLKPSVRVIGVEPELAADARDSLRAGERVAWAPAQTARTLADGLRVGQVGELNWLHLQALVDDIVTVSEEEMLQAMRRALLEARVVAEPSGAVSVAAGLRPELRGSGTVAVVSGGTVEASLLTRVLAEA